MTKAWAKKHLTESAECEPPDQEYRRWKCDECGGQGGDRGKKKFCSACDAPINHCPPVVRANAGKDWHAVGTKHEVGEVDYAQEFKVPEWAGQDDFGGEDFACFTGTEEERAATGALVDRLRAHREEMEAMGPTLEELLAPSLQVEKAWEGRVCAICGEPAVDETWMWGMGSLPICARHAKGG